MIKVKEWVVNFNFPHLASNTINIFGKPLSCTQSISRQGFAEKNTSPAMASREDFFLANP